MILPTYPGKLASKEIGIFLVLAELGCLFFCLRSPPPSLYPPSWPQAPPSPVGGGGDGWADFFHLAAWRDLR